MLAHPAENAWLSVLCMPLAGPEKDVDDPTPVRVRMMGSVPNGSVLRPIRLSDFTPGVWCQFAAAMSRFEADISIANAPKQTNAVTVDNMEIEAESGRLNLALSLDDIGGTVTGIRPEGAPDPGSQLEEKLYVVVTRYVTDAFDRLRERPMAVYALADDTLTLTTKSQRVWSANPLEIDGPKPFQGKSGRVRFLRIMWAKSRDDGGFLTALKEEDRFRMLFGMAGDPAAALVMNPLDAIGMALGISAPVEWVGPSAA